MLYTAENLLPDRSYYLGCYVRQALGAGDNPNCGELPYVVAKDPLTPGPVVVLVSCWELSDEELADVIRTKRVYAGVCAHPLYRTQPPIYVMGVDPFTTGENVFIPIGRTQAEDTVNEIIRDSMQEKAKEHLTEIRDAQPE